MLKCAREYSAVRPSTVSHVRRSGRTEVSLALRDSVGVHPSTVSPVRRSGRTEVLLALRDAVRLDPSTVSHVRRSGPTEVRRALDNGAGVHPSTVSRVRHSQQTGQLSLRAGTAKQSRCERKSVRHEIATAASLPPGDDSLHRFALPRGRDLVGPGRIALAMALACIA